MNRHASLDELADLGAGVLRPRKASRVERHLADCQQCTQLNTDLSGVPTLLATASTQYPAMPDNLSARIDTALASESRQRLASAPQAESGRRDLPARSARGSGGWRPSGSGWHLPGLSVPASRVLAGAAAAVIVGGGGYLAATELTSGAGPSASSNSSSGSGGAPAAIRGPAGQEQVGPKVTYGHARAAQSIPIVTSGTNFTSANLATQATVAVREARLNGIQSGPAAPVASPRAQSPAAGPAMGTSVSQSPAQLAGCIDNVAPGRKLLLVERAKYQGKPADIIVTAANDAHPPEVWVVGPSCSATHSDVLDHLSLPRP